MLDGAWRFLSWMKSMFSSAPARTEPSAESAPDVGLTDEGFTFGARAFRWSSVMRIRTYKLDFETIDCVCLRLELDAAPPLEVTEESNGFNDFMDAMLERFPSIDADWYATVMTPAFERNEALLFEKTSS
jgi:hypothetical protein